MFVIYLSFFLYLDIYKTSKAKRPLKVCSCMINIAFELFLDYESINTKEQEFKNCYKLDEGKIPCSKNLV